jgi:glycerophosphoryl diester phosphodiesterase
MNRIEVTGHRGAALLEPENTLRSIRKAIALQCDRVEIDVHHCGTGELVVIHDEMVDRTTNGSGLVADMSFEQIRHLDAGNGERIPTLQEVIDVVKGRIILQIELKGPGTATSVIDHIKRNDLLDEVVVTSFYRERIEEARRLLPELRFGYLTSTLELDPFRIAIEIGAGAVHLHHTRITPMVVDECHGLGLELRAWNIDDASRMREVAYTGVDGIGSNRPDLLINVLRELGLRDHARGPQRN